MTTATRPRFSGGDPTALSKRIAARRHARHTRRSRTDSVFEEVLLDCARCPYAYAAHVNGQCPDEATAVAVWGRS